MSTALEVKNINTDPAVRVKGGPKRDELRLYEDRARLAQLMHQGIKSPQELADRINQGRPEELHISVKTIANDIKWLKKQWQESAVYDFAAARMEYVSELEYLKKLAYIELFKSQDPKITTTKEASVNNEDDIDNILDGGDPSDRVSVKKTITKEENREASIAFMQLINKIILDQCKLMGLENPTKLALTDSQGRDLPSIKEDIMGIMEDMKGKMVNNLMGRAKVEEPEESEESDE